MDKDKVNKNLSKNLKILFQGLGNVLKSFFIITFCLLALLGEMLQKLGQKSSINKELNKKNKKELKF